MISFAPTEEQEVVRETLRGFAADVLRPAARANSPSKRLTNSPPMYAERWITRANAASKSARCAVYWASKSTNGTFIAAS